MLASNAGSRASFSASARLLLGCHEALLNLPFWNCDTERLFQNGSDLAHFLVVALLADLYFTAWLNEPIS